MNISATEKGTGKSNSVTIKSEKGRLGEEEIERLVKEAEKYKAEDDAVKKKIEAKNGLENFCFQIKNTLTEEKMKDAFEEDDKKTIEELSAEGLQWMEGNPDADGDADTVEVVQGPGICCRARPPVVGPVALPRPEAAPGSAARIAAGGVGRSLRGVGRSLRGVGR